MSPKSAAVRPALSVVVLVVFALLASACASATNDAASNDAPTGEATVGDDVASAEEQVDDVEVATTSTSTAPSADSTTIPDPPGAFVVDAVAWEPCGQLECATIIVPADYDDLDAGTIPIAVNMLRASDPANRIGVLMINPGGPGAPGTDLTLSFAFGGYPDEITEQFDVVGFDPRGVGQSGPTFACGVSGEQLEILSVVDDIYDTPEEIAAGEAAVQLCVDSMGPLAGRIHTDFVVRDMDEIRKAMGEDQISYLGYSYGSLIGAWYATLFPNNVRSMVIDGANNPLDEQDTFDERLDSAREELQPIEDLLRESLEACNSSECPIFNSGDPVSYYFNAANKFDLINEANADNPDTAFLALITPLYNQAQWPQLWSALADLQERDDPAIFSSLAEFQLGDDPGSVNITAHINCLDAWALRPENDRAAQFAEAEEFAAVEDEFNAEFPLLAAIDSGSAGTCAFYDAFAPKPLDGPLDGGGVPILVVGNTSDPVTSFGESEELANDILTNGVLIEVDHASHTVYPANSCVNEVVDAVLLDAEYPTEQVSCGRETTSDADVLFDVCQQITPDLGPSLTSSEVDSVCETFVDEALSRLGEDAVFSALFEDDAAAIESGEALVVLLREIVTAAGG